MRFKIPLYLWIITAIATLGLGLLTVRLYQQAKQPNQSVAVVIAGANSTVNLHRSPDASSAIVTILQRGSQVRAVDSTENRGVYWVKIENDELLGWVPASVIRILPSDE